jgi:hypothetical protein
MSNTAVVFLVIAMVIAIAFVLLIMIWIGTQLGTYAYLLARQSFRRRNREIYKIGDHNGKDKATERKA